VTLRANNVAIRDGTTLGHDRLGGARPGRERPNAGPAQAGDEQAVQELTDPYRRELQFGAVGGGAEQRGEAQPLLGGDARRAVLAEHLLVPAELL
jgi:hypothetical protein